MENKEILTKPSSNKALESLIVGTIALDNDKPRRIVYIKTHTGPPVKIRCKCAHAQRYHGHREINGVLYEFSGKCNNCKCKEFRKRDKE